MPDPSGVQGPQRKPGGKRAADIQSRAHGGPFQWTWNSHHSCREVRWASKSKYLHPQFQEEEGDAPKKQTLSSPHGKTGFGCRTISLQIPHSLQSHCPDGTRVTVPYYLQYGCQRSRLHPRNIVNSVVGLPHRCRSDHAMCRIWKQNLRAFQQRSMGKCEPIFLSFSHFLFWKAGSSLVASPQPETEKALFLRRTSPLRACRQRDRFICWFLLAVSQKKIWLSKDILPDSLCEGVCSFRTDQQTYFSSPPGLHRKGPLGFCEGLPS